MPLYIIFSMFDTVMCMGGQYFRYIKICICNIKHYFVFIYLFLYCTILYIHQVSCSCTTPFNIG